MILEVAVDGPEALHQAVAGGADRVLLCSAASLGGLSPAPALLQLAVEMDMPAVAMIRPRPGDFVWTRAEVDFMLTEIRLMQEIGAIGVVLGASLPDGRLDPAVLQDLVAAVEDQREAVLSRAFDLAPDPFEALETAVALGFDRIMTSGTALRAGDALRLLALLHERARDRLTVMPAGGITAENIGDILAAAPFAEIHGDCWRAIAQNAHTVLLGLAPAVRQEVAAENIRALGAAFRS